MENAVVKLVESIPEESPAKSGPHSEHDPGNDSAAQLFEEDVCSCCSGRMG